MEEAKKEVMILETLDHPCIIGFHDMLYDPRRQLLYIIMEYANGKWSFDA